jgi:hypothetical protein
VPTQSVASTPSVSPTDPSTSATPDPLSPFQTVRAWVKAQNHALRTGDTSEMRALAAANCRGCDNLADPIDEIYAKGGRYDTDGWTVDKAKARSLRTVPVLVIVGVTIASGKTIPEAGADPVPFDEDKHLMLFKLIPENPGWLISSIGFVS